jgi:hypothetical protein
MGIVIGTSYERYLQDYTAVLPVVMSTYSDYLRNTRDRDLQSLANRMLSSLARSHGQPYNYKHIRCGYLSLGVLSQHHYFGNAWHSDVNSHTLYRVPSLMPRVIVLKVIHVAGTSDFPLNQYKLASALTAR